MADRKTVLILLLLAAEVFYARPMADAIPQLREEATFYLERLREEQALADMGDAFEKRYDSEKAVVAENRARFFPAEVNTSAATGRLQQQVKGLARECGLDFLRSSGGEPTPGEGGGYVRLPLAVMLRGGPPQMDRFFERLREQSILIKVETANLAAYQKEEVRLTLNLVAYKLSNAVPDTARADPSPSSARE